MILLLGGTSDTAPLADMLAQAGYDVLVSTATDEPLNIGKHPNIRQRVGRLDIDGMKTLLKRGEFKAVVDATHPYASNISAISSEVAGWLKLPYFSFFRSSAICAGPGIFFAENHTEAAKRAFEFDVPVLSTIGSNNLAPYAQEAEKRDVPLVVRVLDSKVSVDACVRLGIPRDHIIEGRGPFTVEDNIASMRKFGIGVLVTKDSGEAGGVNEKLDAAAREKCHVIVVSRPERRKTTHRYETYCDLVKQLCILVPPSVQ